MIRSSSAKLLLERQGHRIADAQIPIHIDRLVEDRDAANAALLAHLRISVAK
jgi:hypothetical protein